MDLVLFSKFFDSLVGSYLVTPSPCGFCLTAPL